MRIRHRNGMITQVKYIMYYDNDKDIIKFLYGSQMPDALLRVRTQRTGAVYDYMCLGLSRYLIIDEFDNGYLKEDGKKIYKQVKVVNPSLLKALKDYVPLTKSKFSVYDWNPEYASKIR